MKIGIFLSTCSTAHNKKKYMDAIYTSILNNGDDAFITHETNYIPCDIAVIFGFYGKNLEDIHQYRKNIYKAHKLRNKKSLFIDADLFRFLGKNGKLDKSNDDRNTFVRICYNSIFFDKGTSFNKDCDNLRWNIIKNTKQIDLLPYRKNGEHILLCLNGNPETGCSWSAGDLDTYTWAIEKIKYIRQYTDRKIIVRFHPNSKDNVQRSIPIKKFHQENLNFTGGIQIDDSRIIKNTTLADDCSNAWAAISFNTSAAVTPIVLGIPHFTDQASSPIYSISNHNLKDIENPTLFEREQWLYNTSYALWNYNEIKDGLWWKRYRSFLVK